jgi:hypothetical protein
VKTFTREQFEDVATAVMKSVCAQVDLTDRQFEIVVMTVAKTLEQSLIAHGYFLPWVRTRRN